MKTVKRNVNGTTIYSKEFTDKELQKMSKSERKALQTFRNLANSCIDKKTKSKI